MDAMQVGTPVLGAYVDLEVERLADGTAPPRPTALEAPDTDLGPHQAYAFQWWMGMVGGFVLVWFGARREYRDRVRSRLYLASTLILMTLALGVALTPIAIRYLDARTVTQLGQHYLSGFFCCFSATQSFRKRNRIAFHLPSLNRYSFSSVEEQAHANRPIVWAA